MISSLSKLNIASRKEEKERRKEEKIKSKTWITKEVRKSVSIMEKLTKK